MSKPINSQTQMPAQTPTQPATTQKVKIGGVEFDAKRVKSSDSYVKEGKKMNCVFLESGLQIDYPDQTDSNKNPIVLSSSMYPQCYTHTMISDLDNATIYGAKNKDDRIFYTGNQQIIQ